MRTGSCGLLSVIAILRRRFFGLVAVDLFKERVYVFYKFRALNRTGMTGTWDDFILRVLPLDRRISPGGHCRHKSPALVHFVRLQ